MISVTDINSVTYCAINREIVCNSCLESVLEFGFDIIDKTFCNNILYS